MLRLAHPTPDRSRRLAATIVTVTALTMVALAGCGGAADHAQPVEAGAAPVTTASAAVDLAVAVGPASVVVSSVGATPSADGSWRASGLVRNDGSTPAAGLHVRATLTGSAGQVLGVVDTDSPVAPVRPGELVPFTVTAPVITARDVVSVAWVAFATGGSTATDGRDLVVSTYWTRPSGDAHRLDLPSYRDPVGAAVPFVLYGSLTNGGAVAVGHPTLVLAWAGTDGRIVAVASGRAVDSDGTTVASMAAGGADDVVVIVDDAAVANRLDRLTPQTWSVGR